jgi:hypothetical protein
LATSAEYYAVVHIFFRFIPLEINLTKKKPPDLSVRGFFSGSGLFSKPFFVQVQPRTVG